MLKIFQSNSGDILVFNSMIIRVLAVVGGIASQAIIIPGILNDLPALLSNSTTPCPSPFTKSLKISFVLFARTLLLFYFHLICVLNSFINKYNVKFKRL